MKQQTTHSILGMALALAASLLLALTVSAQNAVDDGETVRVNSRVVRVAITVPPSRSPALMEVRGGSEAKTEFSVDSPGPASPLSLVILLDPSTASGKGWALEVQERLKKLPQRLGLVSPPRVIVAAPASATLPFKLPGAWAVSFAGDVRPAFDQAIAEVEQAKYPRRALLIITDRFADLPRSIFEETDERLLCNASLVSLMTVRPQRAIKAGSPERTISRINLVGWQNVSLRASSDYISAMFDYFERMANSLHVVSFPVAEEDLSAGNAYEVEVKAVSEATGALLNRQSRRILLDQSQTFMTNARTFPFASPPPSEAIIETVAAAPTPQPRPAPLPTPMATPAAQAQVSSSASANEWLESAEFKSLASDPSKIFDRIETDAAKREKDIAGLPEWVKSSRVHEGVEVEKVRAALGPLFATFPAASKIELFVYKSDAVFVALAERSLIVISTGAVRFFTGQELSSAASHELSHLYFFEAYLDAFMRRDYATLQLIELKCDALGETISVRAGASPGTLEQAVRRHEQLLQQLGQYDPVLVPMHPSLAARLAFLSRVGAYLHEWQHPERAGR